MERTKDKGTNRRKWTRDVGVKVGHLRFRGPCRDTLGGDTRTSVEDLRQRGELSGNEGKLEGRWGVASVGEKRKGFWAKMLLVSPGGQLVDAGVLLL